MRKIQWFVLSIFFILIGYLFIQIDGLWNLSCQTSMQNIEAFVTTSDVLSCINSEIYDPFILLFFPLGILFLILGLLEPKSKK
jgi:hypothetical protein